MNIKETKLKNNNLLRDFASGFTLIEVIIGLLLVAILGTMLVTFMGNNLSDSAQIVNNVAKTYRLDAVMENFTTRYKNLLVTDATPLATLSNNVGAQGTVYNNSYGSYKVKKNGYIIINCTGKSCAESNGGASILKVTITDPADTQTVTALFTQ